MRPSTLTSAYMERLRLALVQARTSLRRYSTAPLTTTAFGYPVNQARYDKWRTFFDGVGSSLDVIAIHAYPERSATVIGLVPTYVRQLKQRYGKPVAVLEFGLPNVSGYGTPTQVGQSVVDQIRAVMSAEPFCAALYQLRDRGTNTDDGEQMFGVLNYGLVPQVLLRRGRRRGQTLAYLNAERDTPHRPDARPARTPPRPCRGPPRSTSPPPRDRAADDHREPARRWRAP